jgi:hypothetical protein
VFNIDGKIRIRDAAATNWRFGFEVLSYACREFPVFRSHQANSEGDVCMKGVAWLSRALAVVALAIGLALVSGQAPRALATVTNVQANPTSVVNPGTSTVTVTANETDGGNGAINLTVAAGTLSLTSCSVGGFSCTTLTGSGGGTNSVTVTGATDGDGTPGEGLTLTFIFTPPTVASPTAVAVSTCQGSSCSPGFVGNINVFPAGSSSATNISFNLSATSVVCGNSVIVTASVTSSGVPVPDGTPVTFTANNGQAGVTVLTSGGTATVTIPVPLGVSGTLTITATSGGASFSSFVTVTCSVAGPPSTIRLTITPTTIPCGNTASVLAQVFDAFGNLINSGVTVSYSSTLGSITPTAPVIGGISDAVLTSFPRQGGTATITARVGSASATGTVNITCQTASPTSAPPTAVPTVRPATTGVLPPNTGDAGLKR